MWYTQIKIRAARSAIDTLDREFGKALEKERITGRGSYWLGNLALHIGCRDEDVQADARKYSGAISLIHRYSPTGCMIGTWSEECPSAPCVKDFVNAFVEDAWITYVAQEEAEQDTLRPRYWTNDPDVAGTVCIDWFEELPEDLEDLLLKLQETSQEHVERKPSRFLGQEGTLEELRRALEDRYDKAIVFNELLPEESRGFNRGRNRAFLQSAGEIYIILIQISTWISAPYPVAGAGNKKSDISLARVSLRRHIVSSVCL